MQQVIKKTLVLLLLLALLLPSFIFPKTVNADVGGSLEENERIIWGVFKAYGFSDEMCAGFLGNMLHETGGSLDPTVVEGIYTTSYNMGFATSMGGISWDKRDLWNNPKKASDYVVTDLFINGYTGLGDPVDVPYSNGDTTIGLCTDIFGNSNSRQKVGLNAEYYMTAQYPSVDGKHYAPGLGLIQFTGTEITKLLNFAKVKNVDPWTLDIQLASFITNNEYGYHMDRMTSGILPKADSITSVEEAAKLVYCKWIYGNGTWGGSQVARATWAQSVYDIYAGTDGDQEAAKRIFTLAGIPYTYNSVQDISIRETVLAPTSTSKLTDGSVFTELPIESRRREEINYEILNSTVEGVSTNSKTYSLYNRFGGALTLFEYYGEVEEPIGLFDHIASYVLQDKADALTLDDLFYSPTRYLSSRVYPDRPRVLSSDAIRLGYSDSRVELANSDTFGKRFALYHASLMKGIASFITYLTIFFLKKDFYDTIHETFNTLFTSPAWEALRTVVNVIMWIFVIFLVVSLVRHALNYLKGKEGGWQTIQRFLISSLAIGLIFTILADPIGANNIMYKISTIAYDIFNQEVNKQVANTIDAEVISSTDGEDSMAASIWKTAMFDPWCEGLFGAKYANLYTQYADVPDANKMEQDYLETHEDFEEEEIYYDSAIKTGDVFVDLGGGKQVRNWAAYALSTMSVYHIGSEVYDGRVEASSLSLFPNALTTATDKELYADTFRWIDAKMNVGPQYTKGMEISNYTNSRGFVTNHYDAAWTMLWKSAMLILLLPVIFKQLKYFILIMITAVQGIYYSLYELVKENTGLSTLGRKLKDNLIGYVYSWLQLYILIFLYNKFIGDGRILYVLAFIIISATINIITPKDIANGVRSIKRGIERYV